MSDSNYTPGSNRPQQEETSTGQRINEALNTTGQRLTEVDLAAAEQHFIAYRNGLSADQRLPRYEAQVQLADVHARRGDLARAERDLTLASDELDSWRARLAGSNKAGSSARQGRHTGPRMAAG